MNIFAIGDCYPMC